MRRGIQGTIRYVGKSANGYRDFAEFGVIVPQNMTSFVTPSMKNAEKASRYLGVSKDEQAVFIRRDYIYNIAQQAPKNVPRVSYGTKIKVKSFAICGKVGFIGRLLRDDLIELAKLSDKLPQELKQECDNATKNKNVIRSSIDIYGIDLDEPKGYCDGNLKNVRYFRAKFPSLGEKEQEKEYGIFTVASDIMVIHGSSKQSLDIYNYETEKKEKEKEIASRKAKMMNGSSKGNQNVLLRFPYISADSLQFWRRDEVVNILLLYLGGIEDIARFLCSYIPHFNKIVYGSEDDKHIYDVKQKIAIYSLTNESLNTAHNMCGQFSNNNDFNLNLIKNKNKNKNNNNKPNNNSNNNNNNNNYNYTNEITNYMCYLSINDVTAFIMLKAFPIDTSAIQTAIPLYEQSVCNSAMFVYNMAPDCDNKEEKSDSVAKFNMDENLRKIKKEFKASTYFNPNSKSKPCYLVLTNVKKCIKQMKMNEEFKNDDSEEKEEKEKEKETKEKDKYWNKILKVEENLSQYFRDECGWKGSIECFRIDDENDINEIDDMMMTISLYQIKKVQKMMLANSHSRAFIKSLNLKDS